MESNNTYQNGKIYKIVDVGYNKCYIGSTVQALSSRMGKHRESYKAKTKGCSSFQLFDEFGLANCKIELVELYPCTSNEELRQREGYHIQAKDCVNKRVEGRTRKEIQDAYNTTHKDIRRRYYEQNKETLLEYHKQYYQANKEHQQNTTGEIICCPICGSYGRRGDRARHEKTKKHQDALIKSQK